MMLHTIKNWLKVALVEQDRWNKLYHSSLGVADGMRDRLGRLVNL
jgi:hypothetical protein